MSWSSGVSSAPWTPNSSWPLPLVAGNNVNINGWVVSSTGGGGGGGGTTRPPESFSITMTNNFVNGSGSLWDFITGWTDVQDNATFTKVAPDVQIYNTTTAGLDLAAGTYTAPFTGVYRAALITLNPGPRETLLVVNGVYPSDTLSRIIESNNPTDTTRKLVNLTEGDVIRVVSGGIDKAFDSQINVVWEMEYLSGIPGVPGATGPMGPAGPSGGAEFEGFSIMLAQEFTYVDPGALEYLWVPDWTDVPDTVTYPSTCNDNMIFNTTTSGLDLAAGTYTAPVSGVYAYALKQMVGLYGQTLLTINSSNSVPLPNFTIPGNANEDGYIYLQAGDVVRIMSNITIPLTAGLATAEAPAFVWQMCLLTGIEGPAGPTGPAGPAGPAAATTTLSNAGAGDSLVNDGTGPSLAVKSVSAGTGVTITDSGTDLEISLSGGLPVIGFTAYLITDQTLAGFGQISDWGDAVDPPYTWSNGITVGGPTITIPFTGYYSVSFQMVADDVNVRAILVNDSNPEIMSTSETFSSFSLCTINGIIYAAATTDIRIRVDNACTVISVDPPGYASATYGYPTRWSMHYLGT